MVCSVICWYIDVLEDCDGSQEALYSSDSVEKMSFSMKKLLK